jgi:2-phosphoglycerate kinase
MPRSTHIVSVHLNFVLCLLALLTATTKAYNPFVSAATPRAPTGKPKLILIGGCPGTGKSTFGMSVALDQGILKCISTDTVRAVMRSFVAKEVSPALHRSSYAPAFEDDNPVRSWKETCPVLQPSVEGLVDDAINRRVSLVVEGVHVMPSNDLIKKWQDAGGVALGVLLQGQNPTTHKKLLKRRGFTTGNIDAEEKKINS